MATGRNDIELLFDDMKNIIDRNRLRVHTEQVMKGRLFINFRHTDHPDCPEGTNR